MSPSGQETRVVDPNTGASKGSKLARFDLIPWQVIWLLAEHYGLGARKYKDRNWEAGYKWSLSFAALHRHLAAFWGGEDIDPDPALLAEGDTPTALHIVAVIWHACALCYYSITGKGTDDRPTTPSTWMLVPDNYTIVKLK